MLLCCAMLCCAVLCCAMLYCAVLCYAMLCYAMLLCCYAVLGMLCREYDARTLSVSAAAATAEASVEPASGGSCYIA